MKSKITLLASILIVLLTSTRQKDGICPDGDVRQNMPVTTPVWPDGVSQIIFDDDGNDSTLEDVSFPLLERIPEALAFAQNNPMVPGITFGCDGSRLGLGEHSLWIEFSGPCSNYDIYNDLYGVSFSSDLFPPYTPDDCNKYDYALVEGYLNPNSDLDDVCNYAPHNEDQMILCGFPVFKDNRSGGDQYRYHVVVGSTSPTYQTLTTNTPINYRIQIVARDLFPWIRTWRDLDRRSCAYNSQLEMFVNFTTRVDF